MRNFEKLIYFGEMKNILVIYHSQTGNTKLLVDWCMEGLLVDPEISLKIKEASNTELEDVRWADGLVLATPENFGTMSGQLKDFFERTYYPARELTLLKPYILLISCETDGTGTDRQIQTIASGYVLKKSLETLIIKSSEQSKMKEAVIELGQTFAAGLVLGIF